MPGSSYAVALASKHWSGVSSEVYLLSTCPKCSTRAYSIEPGFPFSFGVFQQYYSTHEPFRSDGSGIAVIGTLAAGLMYFLTPVVIAACKRFPHLRRLCTFLGLIIMSLALVASSFAQTVWQLIITQGLLYALGGCMLYMPTMQYLDEWFVNRKGFALAFAHSIGLSEIAGSSTLSLLNAATVVGGPLMVKSSVLLGALSDKYDVTYVMVLASIGSVISIFLIWGFSTTMAPLYIFSIIYGLFGGGFSSCWATMVKKVQKQDPGAETGLVFGAFAAGRGIGCIASGPLASALLKGGEGWKAGAAYGTGYGLLIVFTGVTALVGGFPGVGKGLKLY
ncbi:MAG: hypothetical protein Q9186_003117 [Xanthomendoza sp. 1 TL-2023]